jgi:hypothetical protein
MMERDHNITKMRAMSTPHSASPEQWVREGQIADTLQEMKYDKYYNKEHSTTTDKSLRILSTNINK